MAVDVAATLRRKLRNVPLARAASIRVLAGMRRDRGRQPGVRFLFYHDMQASERAAFERQLAGLRNSGDLVGPSDALGILAGGGGGRHICLTFDDGCRGAFDHALPILAERGIPAIFFIVAGWIDEGRSGVIGWDMARRLHAAGMDVGSHSMTHRRLAVLDHDDAAAELALSRRRIEMELRSPCLHFACPWGQPDADYNRDREPQLARDAGYLSFFTTIPHRAVPGCPPWALPRIRMEPGWGDAELRYALCR